MRTQLVVALSAGFCLLSASSAFAGFSIAPFSMKIKVRFGTFSYPTPSSGTLSCAACYSPPAVFSASGTTGTASYFYGPQSVNPRTTAHPSPTSGYFFNPYWGAQGPPGITSSGGAHPGTKLSPAVATVTPTGNPQAGPDFVVAPSQPGLKGIQVTNTYGFTGASGIGTKFYFLATNHNFALASGAGPGTKTYTAVAGAGSRGKVRFTKGGGHANGFGGTLGFLGGTTGFYTMRTRYSGASCMSSAVVCYYRVPWSYPLAAAVSGSGQNTLVNVVPYYLVNVFSSTTTSVPAGMITAKLTTHPATTGTVVMSQPFGSGFTVHSVQGSDDRTSMGAGNITLVTGWLTHRVSDTSTSDIGGTSVYKFHFHATQEAPSLTSPGLAALGALIAISTVYVIRKTKLAKH